MAKGHRTRITRRALLAGGTALAGAALVREGLRPRPDPARLRVTATDAPALPGGALDFLVVGDTGQDTPERAAVVASMSRASLERGARFVVLAGDNVYPAGVRSVDDPAWVTHFERPFAAPGLDVPFYPCLGNHDLGGDADAQVAYSREHPRWRFPARHHTFEESADDGTRAAFFVLDTATMRDDPLELLRSAQTDWLANALSASRADWKVVIGHHPLWSGGPKGGSGKIRWLLADLFVRHGVDLYLSGHNHGLELLDPRAGWLQVVSGSGSHTDAFAPTERSLFCRDVPGFVRVSLGRGEACLEYHGVGARPLGTFHVERAEAAVG